MMSPLFFLPAFLSLFSTGAHAEAPLLLSLGEQKSIDVEPGTRFSVGNSSVIQVKSTLLSGGKAILLVKGKSQGYSDLILIGADGTKKESSFRVVSKRQGALVGDGKAGFQKGSGLQLQASGDGWVAKGSARTLEDWNTVRVMEAQAKGRLQSLAGLHPIARLKAESQLRKRLRAAGFVMLKVRGIGSTVLLEGEVRNAAEKELAEQLAREVLRDVRSEIRVPFEGGGTLRFRARILEMLRGSARALGLKWTEELPGALRVGGAGLGTQLAFEAALRLMERNGEARLLSQPQILLNEKGVAELKVGGEIPIPLQGRGFSSVQWKSYGLLLRLALPGISRSLARTQITVEISTLDPANGSDGIPALRLSRMDTVVDLEMGKMILLSGLMESRQSRKLQGVPFLGDIPVLGELFRSRDFQEDRSELVILLEGGKG